MRAAGLAAGILCLSTALPARGQISERLTPLQTAAACAPLPASWLPPDPIRLVGSQGSIVRLQFGPRDLVILSGGAGRGITLNQRFYIRRPPRGMVRHGTTVGPRGANTVGWLRVVAVNESTAIGFIEFACDSAVPGDLLQSYTDPVLPPNADRSDTSGEPDFNGARRVLFGDSERYTGAAGDFLVSNAGSDTGAAPGSRFAVYRNLGGGVPLAPIGEAVAISVDRDFSVIRVTRARDAITTGDLLVPRRQ
jgi:hypothetical protein